MFEDNQQQPQQSQQPETPVAPQSTPQPPAKPTQPAELPVKTTQEERIWAAIGYVAFLGVVAMAMKPQSEFCKKHASQGLVIFAIWFIGLIVLAFPSFIGAIGGLILLAATILAVLGIVKAIQSYQFNIPVLSDIASKIPVSAIVGSVTGKTVETPPQVPQQQEQPEQPAQPEVPQAPTQPEAPENTEEKPQ